MLLRQWVGMHIWAATRCRSRPPRPPPPPLLLLLVRIVCHAVDTDSDDTTNEQMFCRFLFAVITWCPKLWLRGPDLGYFWVTATRNRGSIKIVSVCGCTDKAFIYLWFLTAYFYTTSIVRYEATKSKKIVDITAFKYCSSYTKADSCGRLPTERRWSLQVRVVTFR